MARKTNKKSRSGAKAKLSRERWLAAALDVFRDEGIEGVRVERLARELDVTKGSFYWHFKDRRELLKSMLKYWDEEFTDVVTSDPDFQSGNPRKRLESVAMMIEDRNLARFDLAIRAWAHHDAEAATAVRKVDRKRIKFVRSLFAEMGFQGKELDARTRIFVVFHSLQQTITGKTSRVERLRLLKIEHKLLTS